MLVLAIVALAACGPEERKPVDVPDFGADEDTGSMVGEDAGGDLGDPGDMSTTGDMTAGDMSTGGMDAGGDTGTSPDMTSSPDMSTDMGGNPTCDEAGQGTCISNLDCQESQVCTVLAGESCCVTGQRGPKMAFEQADNSSECYSGVTAQANDGNDYCITKCSDVSDCDPGFKRCDAPVWESGPEEKWCLPELL
jgi:hypothetical protein